MFLCALLQASHLQVKSLDALSKLREARLALMNDKIMEQKFIEIHDQLDRLKIKEASLLEQQNELTNSIAAYENLNMQLEEQKKAQVSRVVVFDCRNRSSFAVFADFEAGCSRASNRRDGHRHFTSYEVHNACDAMPCNTICL